jgi:hypothetical protein
MIDWSYFPLRILQRLQAHPAMRSIRHQPRIWRDTSNFTSIDYGDIILVDNRYFLVVGYTREGRFGIDDQPKQWVPKVHDLETGESNILKLVFHETYSIKFGELEVKCYRSPEKEARVIDLVRGNSAFMQGYTVLDDADNLVRILDVVPGKRLDTYLQQLGGTHRQYFEEHMLGALERFLVSVRAISMLHSHGLKHGDIRRDHIFVNRDDGSFLWIDFDYDFYLPERPYAMDLLGLGNVLLYIVSRQNFRPQDVLQHPEMGEKVFSALRVEDMALLARDRVFNLKKLYPYIPARLNDILLHFSAGTSVIYDTVDEFHDELAACVASLRRQTAVRATGLTASPGPFP